jgi:hypothetical protein
MALSMPDRPDQHVVRYLNCPGRRPGRQGSKRDLHMTSCQIRQPDSTKLLSQRLSDCVPV